MGKVVQAGRPPCKRQPEGSLETRGAEDLGGWARLGPAVPQRWNHSGPALSTGLGVAVPSAALRTWGPSGKRVAGISSFLLEAQESVMHVWGDTWWSSSPQQVTPFPSRMPVSPQMLRD